MFDIPPTLVGGAARRPGALSLRQQQHALGKICRAAVIIVMVEPYQHLHDDWGREGVCVPGS